MTHHDGRAGRNVPRMGPWHAGMAAILSEARELVARPGNNFDWSGWTDADQALAEIDTLLAALERGGRPDSAIKFLFLPTGPLQELSLSSGWGDEFVELAARCDLLLR